MLINFKSMLENFAEPSCDDSWREKFRKLPKSFHRTENARDAFANDDETSSQVPEIVS